MSLLFAGNGHVIPINHDEEHTAAATGQTGMSKHYKRKAKMTATSNGHQSQNVGENFQLMIDAKMMSEGE